MLIFKKGNKNDLNNYRGITLTSCVSKIFNRIVANSISTFVENNNILSEVQGGFRKNHRCEDHVFTLKSIAATRLAENKQTYMAFLDFRDSRGFRHSVDNRSFINSRMEPRY